MDFLDKLIDLIDSAIDINAENNITMGGIIACGFNCEIDADRDIVEKAHIWIIEYREELIQTTGITSLKIKFTHNTGYFIEIPRNQSSRAPEDFTQTQTLTQASRFTTDKLRRFEQDLDLANSQLFQKEYNLFIDIRDSILSHFNDLYNLSRLVSKLDFYSNGSYLMTQKRYIIPNVSKTYNLNIIGGQHPVILEESSDFISNDLVLQKSDFIHVITGPNMGGKSTYLRQNALLIILAHIGYPISAKQAHIPIVDKVFSRVGSGDNLFLGQSTFMVEMQEIAYILHNSTEKSFVIIDEIGRGTSTYDGMSLAWSILRHNHDNIRAKTLFATHYHEIIDHSNALKYSSNYSVAVGENNENIVFLRKIVPGGIKKSYGIEVAKLAGIPPDVLNEAKKTMIDLKNNSDFHQLSFDEKKPKITKKQKNNESIKVSRMIGEVNINNISPVEALLKLEELQRQVKK